MGDVNERLREYVSKEFNQRELHNNLLQPGLRGITLDFTGIGIQLKEDDKPLIESFVAAACKKDPGYPMQDEPRLDHIEIKKGKAIVSLK